MKFSSVNYSDSLAFASGDGLGGDETNLGVDTEHGLQSIGVVHAVCLHEL